MSKGRKPRLSQGTQNIAMYIAMVVRNDMENFHSKYLSNRQMKELNPIIRNAICTALYALQNYDDFPPAKDFVEFNVQMIPEYWEKPKLTHEFLDRVEAVKRLRREEKRKRKVQ